MYLPIYSDQIKPTRQVQFGAISCSLDNNIIVMEKKNAIIIISVQKRDGSNNPTVKLKRIVEMTRSSR